MVKATSLFSTLLLLTSGSLTLAHEVGESASGLVARQEHVVNARRALESCQNKLKARSIQSRENRRKQRRDAFAQQYKDQQKQNTQQQKSNQQQQTSQQQKSNQQQQNSQQQQQGQQQGQQSSSSEIQPSATVVIASAASSSIASDPFSGVIPTCVLAPEEEVGPYYLSGELIRDDIRESEPGIDLLLDVQVFDVNTCEVLPDIMLDFWNCNSTGVYSGFEAENTLGETQLRGLVASDSDGIVQLTTIFPGHYSGRATHLHIVAHYGGTVLENGTYTSGTVPHIGQVFFPQEVITAVEATSPYDQNTIEITLNSVDRVYTEQAQLTDGYNDTVTIEYLGDSLEDGLFGYISLGLNLTASYSTVFSTSSGDEGSGGDMNGTAPSGVMSGIPTDMPSTFSTVTMTAA